jgi:hypothetical protein
MAASLRNIWEAKVIPKEVAVNLLKKTTRMKTVFQLVALIKEKASVAQRMMLMEETSNASSATRHILAIPPCTHI